MAGQQQRLLVGCAAFRRATKWALFGVGVWMTSIWKPSGSSLERSSSATAASLPGGLDVLIRTSSRSSPITSLSAPGSCALADWAAKPHNAHVATATDNSFR